MLISVGLFRFREYFGVEVGGSLSRLFLKGHAPGHGSCQLPLMRCLWKAALLRTVPLPAHALLYFLEHGVCPFSLSYLLCSLAQHFAIRAIVPLGAWAKVWQCQ